MQNFGEKVMIAIPLALIIQRNEEQVVAFQDIQHFFAIFPFGDSIA